MGRTLRASPELVASATLCPQSRSREVSPSSGSPYLVAAAIGAVSIAARRQARQDYGWPILSLANERDAIADCLAPGLVALVGSGDERLASMLAYSFAAWCSTSPRFFGLARAEVLAFAGQALRELAVKPCEACSGTKRQQRRKTSDAWEKLGPDRGRSAATRSCPVCLGSGRPAPDTEARAAALGIGIESYLSSAWPRRYELAGEWIRRLLVPRAARAIAAQLEE